jgi:ABC-2 type transport system ATP-binding protein
MPPVVAAELLSKTFRVKVRDPGLGGAFRALVRPRYRDVHAVRDVTFRIDSGEIVAFLGPNGAGKTTTLKMLAGLLYPTSGRVEVAGFAPWSGGPAFKRRIALVLGNRQQLVWDLPPEETFQLNRAIYDIAAADYEARLAELAGLLELGDVRDKPVRQLSLGERMKCELAASLLHHPPLLFLDEPTLGLDVTAQEAIRRFLIEYRDRHGATILLTSHYMQDVTALASRVLMINRGRLLYDGALEALVARIARTKRIELVLGGGDGGRVTAETLKAFGEVKTFRFPNAVLEVRREDAPATSARLLAALPVADLSIEDPPIEEVIREAFTHGVGEGEDDS